MDKIKALRGFKDLFEEDLVKYRYIGEVSRKYFKIFGFKEIETPILERTELFFKSIGEGTDIVEKEMFTFFDKGGDQISLRPEATAGVVRAYLEHKIYEKEKISKFFTIGPMFRYERPQKGRLRQFHQINVEAFGIKEAFIDAELILLITLILKELKIEDYKVEINSVGCRKCREKLRTVFLSYFKGKEHLLCLDCRRRLEKNPLRVLDCKNDACSALIEKAPLPFDHICEECRNHFESFKSSLSMWNINFFENKRLVRGLDYYSRTVFEITSEKLGAQKAFIAGGRYDDLIESMGGPSIPGIGFAIGLERISLLFSPLESKKDKIFFFAYIGEGARAYLYPFLKAFAEKGISLFFSYEQKSLKAQLRYADSLKAEIVMILGEEEIKENTIILRNMHDGRQKKLSLDPSAVLEFALSNWD